MTFGPQVCVASPAAATFVTGSEIVVDACMSQV
jgi:hypothetical protein